MSTNAAINGKQEANTTHIEDLDSNDKPARRGNPLMRTLTPDMIRNPYELEFANGMMSDAFAWEKVSKQVLEPLGISTDKEWMDFSKNVWRWYSEARQT